MLHDCDHMTVCKRLRGRSLWCCSVEGPWFPRAELDQRGLADRRAGVLYTVCKRIGAKPLGKVQKCAILLI
jgi:hypothetical protein